MSSIDDRFREGLGDRKPDVPRDLWAKIAAKKAAVPAGESLDYLFADKLAQRQAPVPSGMWARIVAARRPVAYRSYAALFLLLLAGGLAYFFWAGTPVPGQRQEVAPAAVVATPQAAGNAGTPAARVPAPGMSERAPASGSGPSGSDDVRTSSRIPTAGRTSTTVPPPPVAEGERPVRQAAVAGLPGGYPSALDVPALPLPALSPLPAAPFRSTGRRFGVEALLGAAYAHQTFGNGTEDARLLRDAREVSEFPTASFQFSLRLRYRISDRLRLLSGLTYVALRNQFEYENVGPTQRMRLERTINRLQLLEIPLLASYELPGRRLRLNVNAGPVINLATRVRGLYIDPDFARPQALEEGGDYRRNIGLGWTASLTTTYLLGKERTTQLLLEPFFKHYPGSFTRPGAALSEKYWVAGLQLGLRKPLR